MACSTTGTGCQLRSKDTGSQHRVLTSKEYSGTEISFLQPGSCGNAGIACLYIHFSSSGTIWTTFLFLKTFFPVLILLSLSPSLTQPQLSPTHKINQSPHSAHAVSGSSSHWHCVERPRLLFKVDFERFSLIACSVGQETVQLCEYYFQPQCRTQHILLNNSLQVPISDGDYAPEHLIKPLTLWYPSDQDNCEPLSCLSTMTQLAMLEKGHILRLQASNTVKNGKKCSLEGECLTTDSNYASPERLMLPLKEPHTQNSIRSAKTQAKSVCSSLPTHTLLTRYNGS